MTDEPDDGVTPSEGQQDDPYAELPEPVFPPLESPSPPPPPTATYGAYPEASQATMALVLSILHFVVCPILGPIGWYLATQEMTAIDAGRRDPANRSVANAARIVGIIGTILVALGILFAVFIVVVALAGGSR